MKGMLINTCTIYPKSTSNVYGEIIYGAGKTYNCRVLVKATKYYDQGVIQISPLTIYLDGDVNVNIDDRIQIDNKNYIVVEINKPKDYVGFHHTELKVKNE